MIELGIMALRAVSQGGSPLKMMGMRQVNGTLPGNYHGKGVNRPV